jgi:hypothetical protein
MPPMSSADSRKNNWPPNFSTLIERKICYPSPVGIFTKVCSICSAPPEIRADIDAALEKGEGFKQLASRCAFSKSSLHRHSQNCLSKARLASHKAALESFSWNRDTAWVVFLNSPVSAEGVPYHQVGVPYRWSGPEDKPEIDLLIKASFSQLTTRPES